MNDMFEELEKNRGGLNAQMSDFQKLWNASAAVATPKAPDTGEAWSSLQRAVTATPEPSRSWTPGLSLAFTMAAVILAAVWMYRPAPPTYDYTNARGQRPTTQGLPDKSMVTLNADSKLSLEDGFNKSHRLVRLQGEAFFSVEKGAYPFTVKAGEAEVTVLGTRFNVYARDGKIAVDVEEGRVAVTLVVDGEPIQEILTAGKSISGSTRGFASAQKSVSPARVAQWREGYINFDSQPLGSVAKEIERFWDVSIKIPQHAVRSLAIEGSLVGGPEDMVKALCKLGGDATYRHTANGFVIERKKSESGAPTD